MKRLVNAAQESVSKVKTDAQDRQAINQASHNAAVSRLNEEITDIRKKVEEVTKENQEKEHQLRKVCQFPTYCGKSQILLFQHCDVAYF